MNPYLEADYLTEGIAQHLTQTLQAALAELPA